MNEIGVKNLSNGATILSQDNEHRPNAHVDGRGFVNKLLIKLHVLLTQL